MKDSRCGPTRRTDEEEPVHRRADCGCAEGVRSGARDGRAVPQARHQPADLYRWKAKYGALRVSEAQRLRQLNTPTSYAITQPFVRQLAEELEKQRPNLIISRMARVERAGKVFIDWSQSMEHKTTVAVYSVRAKHDEPFGSMPVQWEDVESADGPGVSVVRTGSRS